MTRARERRVRPEDPQAPEGGDRARGSTSCSGSSASPATRTATPRSSPAASASAWRSPARSRSSRACCCSTSRSARSTRTSARSCARWLRRLHEEVPVTTVIVTHDQEEAMEIADRIAVMSHGHDRAGRPAARALRAARRATSSWASSGRSPSSAAQLVRPHDLHITRRRRATARAEAMVARVAHLGFEVRVDLVLADGGAIGAQVTRGEAEALELREGDVVWVGPDRGAVQLPAPRARTSCRSALDPGVRRRPRARSPAAGSSPAARSASVTPSSTMRRLARSATHIAAATSAAPVVGEALGPGPADRRERALDGAQDVGDRDLGGGPVEPVAALGAAPARDDPGRPQLAEDVLEELQRDVLRGRDPLALDRPGRPRRRRARRRRGRRSRPWR